MKHSYEEVPGQEPTDNTKALSQDKDKDVAPQEYIQRYHDGRTNPAFLNERLKTTAGEYDYKRYIHESIRRPDDLAPVGIVRAYVVAVLHTFYEVPRDEAGTTAERWQGKLGRQFLAIKSEEQFVRVFGDKHGSLLWDYYETQDINSRKEFRTGVYIISGLLAAIAIIAFLIHQDS